MGMMFVFRIAHDQDVAQRTQQDQNSGGEQIQPQVKKIDNADDEQWQRASNYHQQDNLVAAYT
jgi:hypothetical protein